MNPIALTESSTDTDGSTPTADWGYQGGAAPASTFDEMELIERYLPLVRNVVDRIKLTLPPQIEAEDLHSVGVIGLIAAVSKYDPAQGRTFAGYAATRIRGAILDELRRMDWCPRRARARARKLKGVINTLEQKFGRSVTGEEVREELGLKPDEYNKLVNESRPVTFVAIDQQTDNGESEGASLHELLADETDVTGREKIEKQELIKLLAQRIASLPETPRKILAMYYHENMRLAEIATVFGLTESRICQIHSQTLIGLRGYLSRMRNR